MESCEYTEVMVLRARIYKMQAPCVLQQTQLQQVLKYLSILQKDQEELLSIIYEAQHISSCHFWNLIAKDMIDLENDMSKEHLISMGSKQLDQNKGDSSSLQVPQ